MDRKISKEAKKELIEALRQRYSQASKPKKTKILDEFVAVAECHRKHAVRLLGRDCGSPGTLDPPPISSRRFPTNQPPLSVPRE